MGHSAVDTAAGRRRRAGVVVAGCALAVVSAASAAGATRAEERAPGALDDGLVASIQGLLAVQRLDGWLLYDDDERNRIAVELVAPLGRPAERWFYFIPAVGEPIAIAHRDDLARFEAVPGRSSGYSDHAELEAALAAALTGAESLAMEHAPESGIPSLSRVDPGTVDLVRSYGVRVQSSADLVQHTVARWLPEGRVAHYLAVHHLVALRDQALSLIAEKVAAGELVTERDVQRALLDGYALRGMEGPPPRVAIGANAANPDYVPTDARSAPIRRGDLLLLDMAARVADAPRPIYADMAWVAYVGDKVPAEHQELFATAAAARDAALDHLRGSLQDGRAVPGYELDRAAREVVAAAGLDGAFAHRTGHSLGGELPGHGAHLDDGDSRDTRPIVAGTGFAVGPGLYVRGKVGVRAQVGAYVSGRRLEITGPVQRHITPILSP